MWKIENGILHKDGNPTYAIGLSYYPSYREDKVPVPRDGDRIGEMKKDLRRMKECGFNIVRFAALGDIRRENGKIVADHLVYDLAKSYKMNLRNFTFKLNIDDLPAGEYTLKVRAAIARGGVDLETVKFTVS